MPISSYAGTHIDKTYWFPVQANPGKSSGVLISIESKALILTVIILYPKTSE
jgi:hypothetical protein